MERRITVFCGNFGSGKTELAYAYSKALRQGGEPVTLVDLDLVNPYFTSGNQRSALAEQGIRVIAPQYLGGDVLRVERHRTGGVRPPRRPHRRCGHGLLGSAAGGSWGSGGFVCAEPLPSFGPGRPVRP